MTARRHRRINPFGTASVMLAKVSPGVPKINNKSLENAKEPEDFFSRFCDQLVKFKELDSRSCFLWQAWQALLVNILLLNNK